jgi:DNA polymerase
VITVGIENSFESWRRQAKRLLAGGIAPGEVVWSTEQQPALFQTPTEVSAGDADIRVPAAFVKLAEAVACFDDASRWPRLYSLLFRLVRENRELLNIESDSEVREARLMEKAVNRDVHKFHAFVRFRQIEANGDELFVAWHEPQHFTVERATPFFARRFGTMRFSILTPKGCAHWDRERLTFSPPATKNMAPSGDEAEEFWLLYYRSIFNPFRLNVSTMKKELPVRHWPTLPESALIPELIREAAAVPANPE